MTGELFPTAPRELTADTATAVSEGIYRYVLRRFPERLGSEGMVVWVMLNPSTADAIEDDPTIRRCIDFTARWGYECMSVVNLYAYRATAPSELVDAHGIGIDIVGDRNVEWVRKVLAAAQQYPRHKVVCAWGATGANMKLPPSPVLHELGHYHSAHYCVGTTKEGHPRHPLYVPGDQRLLWWDFTTAYEDTIGAGWIEAAGLTKEDGA